MEGSNSFDEEDEDVVIQGSALHEHLSNLGYTDFESVAIPKKPHCEQKTNFHINVRGALKQIYIKLMSFCSWIMQENKISEKQLSTILKTEVVLDDHLSMINNFLPRCNNNSTKIALQELLVTGIVLASSCISMYKYRTLPILFAASAICCAGYMKYLRLYAHKALKNVVTLQNELSAICKESLKILRRDYNIKHGFQSSQQLFHFLGDKYQHLQLLTNTLIQFLGDMSCIYHESSLTIAGLLPTSVLSEESFTKFEPDAFEIDGELSYQAVMKLYHTHLLVQSEMLYLLAVAYDSNTWVHSCRQMPETKLARIIHALNKTLMTRKVQLSRAISAYRACKAEPIRYMVQNRAKWHDPTIQLDLASYKLQSSYSQVFSIFKDLDDYINLGVGIDKETAKAFMERLTQAFKEMDTAKCLAEFVVLLMARSEFNSLGNNAPVNDDTAINASSDLPVMSNSDPEILDEVFEEYIKEEYRKPEDVDDGYTLERYKLDKLLAKSFMSELREALVDKCKSMSERESKALQRMYRTLIDKSAGNDVNETGQRIPAPSPMPSDCAWPTTNDERRMHEDTVPEDAAANIEDDGSGECRHIPVPPAMPSCYVWSTSGKKESDSNGEEKSSAWEEVGGIKESGDSSNQEPEVVESTETGRCKIVFNRFSEETRDGNEDEGSVVALPRILLETQAARFAAKLPPAFLQEETFIGSGENSEDDEIVDGDTSDEDNKNFQ